jgi:23S rRNA (adenine2030-N6)-methyltransferase
MLSYQHAYHAGNPADVHKHLALVLLLRQLQQKESAFCFVDTHAGRGRYDLEGDEARKTGEAVSGIQRLAAAAAAIQADPPSAVSDYLEVVQSGNPGGRLRYYPGSAALAQSLLREQDRAILLELHPQEVAALKASMRGDRRLSVHARSCYEGLPALLPPPIRRGLVLIDPSYEIKTEFTDVVQLLGKALGRWGNAIVMLWYPMLAEARHRQLRRLIEAMQLPKLLFDEFCFAPGGVGLQGSGLAIVNPPWKFATEFSTAMRFVAQALSVTRDPR